jgi:hypothetical protein
VRGGHPRFQPTPSIKIIAGKFRVKGSLLNSVFDTSSADTPTNGGRNRSLSRLRLSSCSRGLERLLDKAQGDPFLAFVAYEGGNTYVAPAVARAVLKLPELLLRALGQVHCRSIFDLRQDILLGFLAKFGHQPSDTVDAFENPQRVGFRNELDVGCAPLEGGLDKLFDQLWNLSFRVRSLWFRIRDDVNRIDGHDCQRC